MKKRLLLCMFLTIATFCCVACGAAESNESERNSSEIKDIDNSKYAEFNKKVVGKEWYIPITGCNECICFSKDNHFEYAEVCGSPSTQNIYHLYSEWKYDKEKELITLTGEYSCDSEHVDGIDECSNCGTRTNAIKYVSCDENTLVLIMDNETKTFTSKPQPVDENERSNRHPYDGTIVTKAGEFIFYIMDHNWIEADGSENEIFFKYNANTGNEEFGYVTASGKTVEGFEQFDTFIYDDTNLNIELLNSDGEESKTLVYVGYIDKKLVLEIDGKEIIFTKK